MLGTVADSSSVEWLSEQLRMNRISQRELAAASGIDASLISRGLSGKRSLHRVDFQRLVWGVESLIPQSRKTPLQEAAWLSRMPLATLAKRTGIQASKLERILSGRVVQVESAEVASLADVLRTEQPTGDRRMEPWSGGEAETGLIPIYAPPTPMAGGGFRRSDLAMQYRKSPEPISGVAGAYGMFVGDDSWEPRWQSGEVIFVHPGRQAPKGAWVLLDTLDEQLTCGRITGAAGEYLTVETPSGERVKLKRVDVQRMEMIVGSWSD